MIKSFEDLIVWQKARVLVKLIYELTMLFPRTEQFGLTDQLRRAVVSICANIAEGFGRYNKQESIQFYRIARGSLLEVKSHLYLALDLNYLDQSKLERIFLEIETISKMLSGLINQTKNFRITTKP